MEKLDDQRNKENTTSWITLPPSTAKNPSDLLDEVLQAITTHVICDYEQAVTVTLWIGLTYIPDATGIAPLLIINAPERACGKSVFLGIVESLAYKPLATSNMTPASMFRLLHERHPTLFMDEADTFLYGKVEMHGMLNAGYSNQNPFVYRTETVKDKLVACAYNVYGLKALAGIAMHKVLPDSTMSRGFNIEMRRKLPGEQVERLRPGKIHEKFGPLRSDLQQFAKDNRQQVLIEFEDLPTELSDRMQDNWSPLFAIARCGGQKWIDRAKAAALALAKSGSDFQSQSNSLLMDIREVLDGHKSTTVTTVDLLEKLTGDASFGWNTHNQGKPMNARQLARFLGNYKIKPKTVRQSQHSTPKGYVVQDFRDAFQRYLPIDEADVVDNMPSEKLPKDSTLDVGSESDQTSGLDDKDVF